MNLFEYPALELNGYRKNSNLRFFLRPDQWREQKHPMLYVKFSTESGMYITFSLNQIEVMNILMTLTGEKDVSELAMTHFLRKKSVTSAFILNVENQGLALYLAKTFTQESEDGRERKVWVEDSFCNASKKLIETYLSRVIDWFFLWWGTQEDKRRDLLLKEQESRQEELLPHYSTKLMKGTEDYENTP